MNVYNKLLKDNITKDYKKRDYKMLNEIHFEAKNLTNFFKIHDGI